MRQRNEKRSKRQRMSKRRRRRTTKKQNKGGRIWQINVYSTDNKLINEITVVDEKKSFAENGITGNGTTKYRLQSSDVEIDYNSIPLYPKGNNPLNIYQYKSDA